MTKGDSCISIMSYLTAHDLLKLIEKSLNRIGYISLWLGTVWKWQNEKWHNHTNSDETGSNQRRAKSHSEKNK